MTYDSYVQKIRRRADRIAKTVSWVKRHRVLLAFAFLALAGAVFALMAFSGSFTNRSSSLTVTYGEEADPGSSAFLCGVSYEYLQNGSVVEDARFPGEYVVRAYTKNVLGIEREHTFTLTVEPRKAALSLLDPRVEYGAGPDGINVYCGGLVNGDRIAYALLEYADVPGEQTARLVSLRVEDKNGEDVTECYAFDPFEPRLTVVPRTVTLTTHSAEKIYDGTPLVCEEYETDKELVSGDELILAFPSLCEAGETENTPEISVKNGKTDVSGYYSLTVVPGTLKVKKRPLTLRTASFETEYDGKPHSACEYEMIEGALVKGHTLNAEWPEDRVNAVSEPNKAVFTVLNGTGEDVTANYDLQAEYGSFVIKQRRITLTTESAEFQYDSVPRAFRNVEVTAGELAEGERIIIDAAPSFTKVGSYTNTISCRIISSERTTTKNYDITYKDGTVTITKRPLTVLVSIYSYSSRNKTFTVEYTPYECVTGINDSLYRMGVVSGSTMEDVRRGAKASVFSIMDPNSNVTFCYDIDYVFTEYTKEEIDRIIKESKSDSSSPDEHGGTGSFGVSYNVPTEAFYPQGSRLGYVRSANAGQMLLRMGSFGDYKYRSGAWSDAVGYGVEPVFDSVYYALASNSFQPYNEVSVHWENPVEFSAVPYFCPVDPKSTDVFVWYNDNDGNGYDDFPLHIPTPSLTTLLKVAQDYNDNNLEYSQFVQRYYLNISPELKELMLSLASGAGIEPGDEKIYEKVRDYILGAAEYSYAFPSVPEGTDPVVYFLTQSKQGVCSHFAAAATLMYRALGVPARYTYGVSVCPYADKKPTPFTDANLHAWVEVYISGFGWIPVDVTPAVFGSSAGDGEEPLAYNGIVVIPQNVTKVFDGEPATLAEYKIYGEELLEEGDHIEINAAASRTYAGYSVYEGRDVVRIVDEHGNDVTDRYETSFNSWEVTVLPIELQADDMELYIGQTVSAPG
ncbi:MAG: transglutaminase domain-containing protein, partial [Clostridia bacterium]|nr:transglutaminase domain-containing protein [Clostridia bacterium]